ncbi:hypothetical protein BDZ89DRAFT_430879 [Hymenopellis radicata]|nr:hypothetical protein BDZ89DRAFT_430879 [Hymenopellis radicata]
MTIPTHTHHDVDESNTELYSNLTEVDVNFSKFYCIGSAKKVNEDFTVKLTKLTYLPKVAEPRRDWVASVAVPSFIAHRDSGNKVTKFATIGTGSGLDAVGALEVFPLEQLAMTDLHPAVVQAAAGNVFAATEGQPALAKVVNSMIALPGDLCTPLQVKPISFDLIYENLPNIPLDTKMRKLFSGQTSSTYVPERHEKVVNIANDSLLALHWLCMVQARELLALQGAIISSMGGRVPISNMITMSESAGYNPDVLTYTWKIQSEPEEVIGGYKRNQEEGMGPFYFYPADVLEETFKDRSPAMSTKEALQLEEALLPYRLDAVEAYNKHKTGELVVAHTVVCLRSKMV